MPLRDRLQRNRVVGLEGYVVIEELTIAPGKQIITYASYSAGSYVDGVVYFPRFVRVSFR